MVCVGVGIVNIASLPFDGIRWFVFLCWMVPLWVKLKHSSPSVILTKKATYLFWFFGFLCCYNRLLEKHPGSEAAISKMFKEHYIPDCVNHYLCIEDAVSPSHFLSCHLVLSVCILLSFFVSLISLSLLLFLFCL